MSGFSESDVTDQSGKTFVVTGANSGLGFEITRVLAARRARVVMACRSKPKADAAIMRIRALNPGAELEFLAYDQSDLDSIRTAAETLSAGPVIDVLINNAGVMEFTLSQTKQGFEQHFGTNHLGSFAFTCLLLPKLAEASVPRVVITGSASHRTGVIDFDDLDNAGKGYGHSSRYANSKLANMLFLFELDQRLRAAGSPIIAIGSHPGLAITSLGREQRLLRSIVVPLAKLLRFNTAAMGAWPSLQAATSVVNPGGYYGPIGWNELKGPSGPSGRSPNAVDATIAQRLWDRSIKLTGVDVTPL
ncbi:oxidoreductase [Sphingomonas hengshuiensis]|uniref:Oxidoreductase n=1 Tax=Sphingomonas hengshuiensis TaxID=1609977 RepID=A0A7U4J8I5_9SPHN|nr:oxidoreductase [Sphingomonas hengshuiensis]AJP72206.1 oxidoreductase [Sphingomonas hengshuiensis]